MMTSRTKAMTFALAILALGTVATARADSSAGSKAEATVNLTGLWRLDRKASDPPPNRGPRPEGGGGGGWSGGGGGGMHGSGGGHGGGPPEGGPPREGGGGGGGPRRLPDLIHISQDDMVVSLEDSTGTVLQEIAVGGAQVKHPDQPDLQIGEGTWKKGELEVSRQGPRGEIHEEFSLADKGATLVVKTRLTGRDGESREFKRVYRRQAS